MTPCFCLGSLGSRFNSSLLSNFLDTYVILVICYCAHGCVISVCIICDWVLRISGWLSLDEISFGGTLLLCLYSFHYLAWFARSGIRMPLVLVIGDDE